jgi:prepilin-type N-terminal cleavage/methylation domain-containing protein
MLNANCGIRNKKSKLRKFRVWNHNSELQTTRLSSPKSPNPELLFKSKGFTLIEIIVVIVILSIVAAISIKFLVDSLRIYTMTVNQKTLLDEGKLALERMCRDIRDGQIITTPAAGGSGNTITFQRTNLTVQDIIDESITFQLNPMDNTILQKGKSSPAVNTPMAFNVATTAPAFSVTRGQTSTNNENEITLQLNLALGSGENVSLQTKVYPKNLLKDTSGTVTYKNFFYCWQEVISP